MLPELVNVIARVETVDEFRLTSPKLYPPTYGELIVTPNDALGVTEMVMLSVEAAWALPVTTPMPNNKSPIKRLRLCVLFMFISLSFIHAAKRWFEKQTESFGPLRIHCRTAS